jgi:transcriptional regulator with XRE-family HTH domain
LLRNTYATDTDQSVIGRQHSKSRSLQKPSTRRRAGQGKAKQQTDSAVSRILDDLEERGGLNGSDIANIVNASRPTVSRWKNGKASPPLATQTIIADLRYVVDRLSDFYAPAETRLWLHAKHPLLNNERAIDLIIADRTQEVLAVIERLDSGAYL